MTIRRFAGPALLFCASAPLLAADWTYEAAGRRDPFRPHGPTDASATCTSGLACTPVDEVQLQGTFHEPSGWTAMVTARGKRYTLRPGEALVDGSVKSIESEGVLFEQRELDPAALKPVREVWRPLRPGSPLRALR